MFILCFLEFFGEKKGCIYLGIIFFGLCFLNVVESRRKVFFKEGRVLFYCSSFIRRWMVNYIIAVLIYFFLFFFNCGIYNSLYLINMVSRIVNRKFIFIEIEVDWIYSRKKDLRYRENILCLYVYDIWRMGLGGFNFYNWICYYWL